VKLEVYEHLLRMNAGFDQAIRSLAALRRNGAFHRSMLERLAALSKETRSATNSYLASAIETAETEEAGRRFQKRKAQEKAASRATEGRLAQLALLPLRSVAIADIRRDCEG
jgi:hypothetical protein